MNHERAASKPAFAVATATHSRNAPGRTIPLFASLLVFLLALLSPVSYAGSDSHFTLLVAQALIDDQTIALDAYQLSSPEQFATFAYQLMPHNGHIYYGYPLGSSLFGLPVVSLANMFGLHMVHPAHNYLLQNVLSALLCAMTFWLVYRLARCYLYQRASLLIALVSVLGSSLISTMATALWSVNLAVVLMLAALIIIVRHDINRDTTIPAYSLASLLFLAYLTRPTAALAIMLVLLYLLLRTPDALPRVGAILFLLFGSFVLFSWAQYQSLLPPYYTASRWVGTDSADPVFALWGLIASPSRGLLFYSPFAIAVVVAGFALIRKRRESLLWWGSLGWFFAHLLTVSSTAMWWGGYSFGPRLLADAMPALALLTILLWRHITQYTRPVRATAAGVYLSLGLFAVWVNSVQGLWNINTVLWNDRPNIDQHPAYLFDYRYPQFLATAQSVHERYYMHVLSELSQGNVRLLEYDPGKPLNYDQHRVGAYFVGWWQGADGALWSKIIPARILFQMSDLPTAATYKLYLAHSALQPQTLTVSLNGNELGLLTSMPERSEEWLQFSRTALRANAINILEFHTPKTYRPPFSKIRELGLAIYLRKVGFRLDALSIEPVDD